MSVQQQQQEGWTTWETVFTNSKAGMDGVDKEKVKKIVWEMSQGSAHFANEQKRQQQVIAKIDKLKQQAAALTKSELTQQTRAVDSLMMQLEASRDLTRTWLHVDMDAFFASVEELEKPELKNVPMAVGGIGMISTANYMARKYGVRSAMPGYIGRKLCPQLVFVPCNFSKYTAASKQVEKVLKHFDSQLTSMSLDEAYLDITDYCTMHSKSGAEVAQELRAAVEAETRLTCSVGVAPNRMLAKVASDLRKPNGQYVLPNNRDAVMKFVETLPVRKVPGVGKVTEQMLSALGVRTCKDLVDQRGLLRALFTPISSEFFLSAGLGLGSTSHSELPAEGEVGRKGIGCERTFRATSNREDLETKLSELCASLVEDMNREGIKGKTLTIKMKTSGFEVRTRAVSLGTYSADLTTIQAAALRLLRAELPLELRLLGVRMSNFLESAVPSGQRTLDSFVKKPHEGGAEGGGVQEGVQEGAQKVPCVECGAGEAITDDCAENGELTLGDWVEECQGTQLELSLRNWDPGVEENNSAVQDTITAGVQPTTAQQTAATGQAGVASAATQQPNQQEAWGNASSSSWTCTVCTFAHNPESLPFCEVCGKFRKRYWDDVGPLEGPAGDPGAGVSPARVMQQSAIDGDTAGVQNAGHESAHGAGADGGRKCEQCGESVPESNWVEHSDWHMAMRLQEQDRAAASPRQTAGAAGKRKRTLTMDHFINTANKKA